MYKVKLRIVERKDWRDGWYVSRNNSIEIMLFVFKFFKLKLLTFNIFIKTSLLNHFMKILYIYVIKFILLKNIFMLYGY